MTANREEQRTRSFNSNDHVMQLKSKDGLKDYLPVQWRLVWFREQCPNGTIETEIVHLDLDKETEEEVFAWNNEKRRSEKVIKTARGIAVFRAVVKDGKGGVGIAQLHTCIDAAYVCSTDMTEQERIFQIWRRNNSVNIAPICGCAKK